MTGTGIAPEVLRPITACIVRNQSFPREHASAERFLCGVWVERVGEGSPVEMLLGFDFLIRFTLRRAMPFDERKKENGFELA